MNEIAKVLSAVLSHVYQWAAYVAVHKKTLIVSVLVPVLQPLIAAIAVIFTVRIEAKKIREQRVSDAKKIRTQHAHERLERAHSTSAMVFFATAASGYLLACLSHSPLPLEFTATLSRVKLLYEEIEKRLLSEPLIGDFLRDKVIFAKPQKNTLRMQLAIQAASLKLGRANRDDIIFVHFVLLTLLYLYESDAQRTQANTYEAILLLAETKQECKDFLIAEETPSFRSFS